MVFSSALSHTMPEQLTPTQTLRKHKHKVTLVGLL